MTTSDTNTNSNNSSGGLSGHPIAVVAERTGLSRDVLRVWERRYGAVEPMRTPGGQRLYSDQEVERFRLLAAATRHGRNISSVAGLPDATLQQLIADDLASAAGLDAQREADGSTDAQDRLQAELMEIVSDAMASTLRFDAFNLDRGLRRAIAQHGVPTFLEDVVPHFMYQIGKRWVDGELTIAHEHLASSAVLAIIHETIRAVPERTDAPRMLVATPAGERHAVGAALVAAAAALDGWTIVYLGVDVPAREIVSAAEAVDARAVGLSAVYSDNPAQLAQEFTAIRGSLQASIPLFVGGSAAKALGDKLPKVGVVMCASLSELRSALQNSLRLS